MNNAPILILQMQRMGDLVLSFPLFGRLAGQFPGHPIWVIGEERFFTPLMGLSPQATYFSYGALPDMGNVRFHTVINLSHRPEAAALAGKVKSDALIGPWLDKDGRLFVNGDWQLYRRSLTDNNRFNLFHWADLNTLDFVMDQQALRTVWPVPKALPTPGTPASIGLFLGASEPQKRPDAPFWAALAKKLIAAGHKPVLLGGQAESTLGEETAALLGAPSLNMCGRFSLTELAHFINELDLFITPDTGPMHVAAWIGTAVLNLSLGPVNPWETGPSAPGHHILQPALDCTGCWRCTQKYHICRQYMNPSAVGRVVTGLLDGATAPDAVPPAPETGNRLPSRIRLLKSTRDKRGLYLLQEVAPYTDSEDPGFALRRQLSRFWQSWFSCRFGLTGAGEHAAVRQALQSAYPEEAEHLRKNAAVYLAALIKSFRNSPGEFTQQAEFWKKAAPELHPLSGYIQMYVQNALGNPAAFRHAVSLLEDVATV